MGESGHSDIPCKDLRFGDHKFDFSELAGPHTVVTTEFAPPSYYNRTYTVDLCGPLKRKGEVKKEYACPEGSRGKVLSPLRLLFWW